MEQLKPLLLLLLIVLSGCRNNTATIADDITPSVDSIFKAETILLFGDNARITAERYTPLRSRHRSDTLQLLPFYLLANNEVQSQPSYTLTVPFGSYYKITLPNSTLFYLDAGSVVCFRDFDAQYKKINKITLFTGQMYVQLDTTDSLTIETSNILYSIASGSVANIRNFADENDITLSMITGTCKCVRNGKVFVLEKGHAWGIHKWTGLSRLDVFNEEKVMAWTKGRLYADDFRDLFRQIARIYNVQVIYSGRIPPFLDVQIDYPIQGHTIDELLVSLQKLYPIKCRLTANRLYISYYGN